MATKWRNDRISKDVDEETGLHKVTLPRVKGLSTAERDALYGFEASHVGTTRAVIRMNKRAEGRDPNENGIPYKIANASDFAEFAGFYEEA